MFISLHLRGLQRGEHGKMECHRNPGPLDYCSTEKRIPIEDEEKKAIAEIFEQEISGGTVKIEHVRMHKKELKAKLPSFQDTSKYLKRVLDMARKLAKNSGTLHFH